MDLTAAQPGAAAPAKGPAFDAWRTWRDHPGPHAVVSAAILAANARNVQPWSFAIGDDRIDLYADLTRRQGALDPFDREMYVGLGCAVENMVLAARAAGWDPEVRLLPTGGDPATAATLRLRPGVPESGELYEAIPRRHTNRGPFRRRAVPVALRAEIDALVDAGLGGAALRWFATPAERARIGAALVAATEAIVADEEQSRCGYQWFRGTDAEVEQHADGMTTAVQGMHPLVERLGRIVPAPSRRTADRFWLRQTRAVHVSTAPAFVMVTVPDAGDDRLRMLGGRLLQRVQLLATARGLAVGHLNMLTVRADRERQTGAPPRFGRVLTELAGDAGEALVTFRIGYPSRRAAASPRRPVSEVLR